MVFENFFPELVKTALGEAFPGYKKGLFFGFLPKDVIESKKPLGNSRF